MKSKYTLTKPLFKEKINPKILEKNKSLFRLDNKTKSFFNKLNIIKTSKQINKANTTKTSKQIGKDLVMPVNKTSITKTFTTKNINHLASGKNLNPQPFNLNKLKTPKYKNITNLYNKPFKDTNKAKRDLKIERSADSGKSFLSLDKKPFRQKNIDTLIKNKPPTRGINISHQSKLSPLTNDEKSFKSLNNKNKSFATRAIINQQAKGSNYQEKENTESLIFKEDKNIFNENQKTYNESDIVSIMEENIEPLLINILESEIFEEAENFYVF